MNRFMNTTAMAVAAAVMSFAAPAMAQEDKSLTIALPSEPADIDGCNTTVTGIGVIVKENIVETLTTLDPNDSTVQPRLATAWEDLGDGTWRISLREGVTFHDGAPFNADSVSFAIDRLTSDAIACRDRTKIASVELTTTIVDDHTIDIHAEPAQILMPTLLSFIGAVSPNTPIDQVSRAPVGTGPFKFESWDAEGIAVTRNADYWGEQPAATDALYIFRPESALRAAMVELGEADIAHDIAPQDATSDMDHPFLNGETTRLRMVLQPPLDDVRVRKAFNLAFDRNALIGTILSDKAQLATQFILPKINGHNPDLEPWAYDVEQAKALLAEAKADGVPVDKELRLVGRIGFFPNQEEMLQVMQQMWSQVGLNVKLEMMESAEWLKLVNKPFPADRDAMLIQEQHDNNNGDASFTMRFRFHSDGRQSEFSIPEVDKLIEDAEMATGEERTKLWQEANRIISEEIVPSVYMYHMVSYMRVSPEINYEPNSLSLIQLELADVTFN